MTIALTASVCGAESCSDFADFAADREGLFREFLRLENGIPSHDTFSRVFRLLDPEAFNRCFGRFIEDLGAAGEGVLAIDGKTLRRSFDRAAKRSPLAVVSAFASASRCVIGQEAFRSGDGGSEILAARALLRCLDLNGRLVTADAIHCQNETAEVILGGGGDYFLRLKANRPALHETVSAYFALPEVPMVRSKRLLRQVFRESPPYLSKRPVMALLTVQAGANFHGRSSSMRLILWSAMRLRTWVSQAWGSTPFSLAVSIRV